jgi:flagellar hook assembly protein FlgD
LVNNAFSAGKYQVEWDGTDNSSLSAPSGVYLYRFEVENFSDARKMYLIR